MHGTTVSDICFLVPIAGLDDRLTFIYYCINISEMDPNKTTENYVYFFVLYKKKFNFYFKIWSNKNAITFCNVRLGLCRFDHLTDKT